MFEHDSERSSRQMTRLSRVRKIIFAGGVSLLVLLSSAAPGWAESVSHHAGSNAIVNRPAQTESETTLPDGENQNGDTDDSGHNVEPSPAPEVPAPEDPPPAEPEQPEDPTPDGGAGDTPAEPQVDDPQLDDEDENEASPEAEHDETQKDPLDLSAFAGVLNSQMARAAMGTLGDAPTQRISGRDRFATAAAVSQHAYRSAGTVVIATGMDYPDSVSAAPLAAKFRAPLLLTTQSGLPRETLTEIRRLRPTNIVIVGGTGVVSSRVERLLKKEAKNVERISGADRYSTSIAVAQRGWPQTHSSVFVATGADYADALSAGAAAGKLGAPVILVPGTGRSLQSNIQNEVNRLRPSEVYIAGGTGVVSTGVERSLAQNGRSITRFAGTDRFDTSAKIVNGIFGSATRGTYLAYGLDFADALSGAAVAGAEQSPLLLSVKTCIPSNVYSASDRRSPAQSYLLGGLGVLTNGVRNGNECMRKPSNASASSWSSTQSLYSRINQARYDRGLAGARVADSTRGMPAHAWASRQRIAFDNGLSKSQPWVNYEATSRSKVSKARPQATFNRIMKDATAKKWLLRNTSGERTFVSVGYAPGSPYSYTTVYVGTGLK